MTSDVRDFAARCAQRTEHGTEMLANVGTREVVKDLDVLRTAVGDEKLSYLGYSYGTQIGYSYAESFAGKVRALVFDGAVDPTASEPDSLIAQGQGFSRAFTLFTSERARHRLRARLEPNARRWCFRKPCPTVEDQFGDDGRVAQAVLR